MLIAKLNVEKHEERRKLFFQGQAILSVLTGVESNSCVWNWAVRFRRHDSLEHCTKWLVELKNICWGKQITEKTKFIDVE